MDALDELIERLNTEIPEESLDRICDHLGLIHTTSFSLTYIEAIITELSRKLKEGNPNDKNTNK